MMGLLILWCIRVAALASAISLVMIWLGKEGQPPFVMSALMIAVWAFSEFERASKKGRD